MKENKAASVDSENLACKNIWWDGDSVAMVILKLAMPNIAIGEDLDLDNDNDSLEICVHLFYPLHIELISSS